MKLKDTSIGLISDVFIIFCRCSALVPKQYYKHWKIIEENDFIKAYFGRFLFLF